MTSIHLPTHTYTHTKILLFQHFFLVLALILTFLHYHSSVWSEIHDPTPCFHDCAGICYWWIFCVCIFKISFVLFNFLEMMNNEWESSVSYIICLIEAQFFTMFDWFSALTSEDNSLNNLSIEEKEEEFNNVVSMYF